MLRYLPGFGQGPLGYGNGVLRYCATIYSAFAGEKQSKGVEKSILPDVFLSLGSLASGCGVFKGADLLHFSCSTLGRVKHGTPPKG
jgi:hypothetical protein